MAIQRIPQEVREAAIKDFTKNWRKFGRPTIAADKIARKYGIGKTTLADWLRADGKWPSPRAMRVLELEAENRALEKEVRTLRRQLRLMESAQ